MSEVELRRLSGSFGLEIRTPGRTALDLAHGGGLDLLSLLEQHLVLVLREQHLTHAQQVQLARVLGTPTPAHPVVPGHPLHPEILELQASKGGKNARWHTDVTFIDAPHAISVLVADQLPPFGGDTLFASLVRAYDTLHAPLQTVAEQLWAVHRIAPLAYWGEPFESAWSRQDAAKLYEDSLRVPPVVHPVVRVHPTTNRKALFVNPGFTSHLVGMSRIESDHLLALFYAHATQPELTIRHRWQEGDVLIWDNRATMHYAVDDYSGQERRMRRVTIAGAKPVGVDGRVSFVSVDPLEHIR
jgi:alpha-ketoglutarate-dependent taurine dioxygenase